MADATHAAQRCVMMGTRQASIARRVTSSSADNSTVATDQAGGGGAGLDPHPLRSGCAACVRGAPSAGAACGNGGVGDGQGRAVGPGRVVLLAQLLRQLPHATLAGQCELAQLKSSLASRYPVMVIASHDLRVVYKLSSVHA